MLRETTMLSKLELQSNTDKDGTLLRRSHLDRQLQVPNTEEPKSVKSQTGLTCKVRSMLNSPVKAATATMKGNPKQLAKHVNSQGK